jgi:hypothetical protein
LSVETSRGWSDLRNRRSELYPERSHPAESGNAPCLQNRPTKLLLQAGRQPVQTLSRIETMACTGPGAIAVGPVQTIVPSRSLHGIENCSPCGTNSRVVCVGAEYRINTEAGAALGFAWHLPVATTGRRAGGEQRTHAGHVCIGSSSDFTFASRPRYRRSPRPCRGPYTRSQCAPHGRFCPKAGGHRPPSMPRTDLAS